MNYIQAAILQHTGIEVSIPDLKRMLIEEGLATADQIRRYEFKGYSKYYGGVATKEPVNIVAIAEDIQEIKV